MANGSLSISLQQRRHGRADEQLLALDAAEVGPAVLVPLAVDPLLVVAAAGVGEGLGAVEHLAAGLRGCSPEWVSWAGTYRADLDAADLVHEPL